MRDHSLNASLNLERLRVNQLVLLFTNSDILNISLPKYIPSLPNEKGNTWQNIIKKQNMIKQHNKTTHAPANKVFMVKPNRFGYNYQTADTNAFQQLPITPEDRHHSAIGEFMQVVDRLRTAGIEVVVFESEDADAPDAIFPNNWFSTHLDGTLVLYPMYAPNRRRERCDAAVALIKQHCQSEPLIDISNREAVGQYLEGTGSILFDHANRRAYAALSPRTDQALFNSICSTLKYQAYSFSCDDPNGMPFYHTNVMLHIGDDYAVIYDAGIKAADERKRIMDALSEVKSDIIRINYDQVVHFCGNMLQVSNKQGQSHLLCSTTALKSFTHEQQSILERHAAIIAFDIPTIEQLGGGSIRCMVAELF